MSTILKLCGILLLFWACRAEDDTPIPTTPITEQPNPSSGYRYLALGDSYTIGESVASSERFPGQLVAELNTAERTVLNPRIIAQTGWRTDNLQNAIAQASLDENYDLVSLLIGVNNQYQQVDFEKYETEFVELLQTSIRLASGKPENVIVLSIPDYAYTPFGQQIGNAESISEDIDRYNAYNRHISDSLEITYFDITPISREGLNEPDLVATDGLHPSGKMYEQWVDLMKAEVEKKLP